MAILCGAVQASARCENLIGVMVFNVRISFFENARPHRVARTRSCSFLSPAFSVLNFYSYAFFSPKISVVVVVILVIVVGVFDHSAVQTAVVVVF